MVDLAAVIWDDYNTTGVPGSGAKLPVKSKIREWGLQVESGVSYITRAAAGAATIPAVVVAITVLGHTAAGAGGATYKEVTDSGTLEAWQFRSNGNSRRWQISERVFDVTMLGAVGDDTADDTSAINNAIAALNAGVVKTLHFPVGQYKISAALTTITAGGISLTGDGPRQSVINQSANANTLAFQSTSPTTTDAFDISILNLGINQTKSAPTSGVALRLTRMTRGYFVNVDIRNVFQGILIEGSNDLHFSNMTVAGAFTWSALATGSYLLCLQTYSGLAGSLPSEIFFDNFNIKGSGSFGGPLYLDNCIIVKAADGLFMSNGHLGFCNINPFYINPQANAALSIQNIEISNVYVDGNGGGSTASSAVLLSGSTLPTVEHIKFDGCAVRNFDGAGMTFDLSTLKDLRITGCQISDNGNEAIKITGCDEILLADNVIKKNNINNSGKNAVALAGVSVGSIAGNMVLAGTSTHPAGLSLDATCSDLAICNNVMQGHTIDYSLVTGTARVTFMGNRKSGSDPTVVASDGFTVPLGYDVVEITGNTNFSNMSGPFIENMKITFKFAGTPTAVDAAGNIKLAGNFVATAGSSLTMMSVGSGWNEVSRAVV